MPHNKPPPQVRFALTEDGLALSVRFKRDHIRNTDLDLVSAGANSRDIDIAAVRLAISQLVCALAAQQSAIGQSVAHARTGLPFRDENESLRIDAEAQGSVARLRSIGLQPC